MGEVKSIRCDNCGAAAPIATSFGPWSNVGWTHLTVHVVQPDGHATLDVDVCDTCFAGVTGLDGVAAILAASRETISAAANPPPPPPPVAPEEPREPGE
jgi:hypothetical protein